MAITSDGYVKNDFKDGMRLDACYLCNMDDGIEHLFQEIADIQYIPIKFTSISNNVGIAEIGSTIETVVMNWSFNKDPVSQAIGNQTIDKNARAATFDGLSITRDTSFSIRAMDERELVVTANTSVVFYNGVYYGVIQDGADITSDVILAMMPDGPVLQNDRKITFTVTAGAGQRVAYAIPNRSPYGTPSFKDVNTGFQAGFYLAETISFTNNSGYIEDYNIWLSTYPGIGRITIAVT